MGYNSHMTTITREEVVHLAELSRLQLTDEEIDSLRTDIANILGYVDQLNELDTSGIEATYQVVDRQNVWREDVVPPQAMGRDELIGLAPVSKDNQIQVPKVL